MESTDNHSKGPAEEKEDPPADEKIRCVVAPRKGSDNATINNVEDDLKKISEAEKIYSFTSNDGIFRWWIVHATPEQLKEIKEHKEIRYAAPSGKMVEARVARHSFERTQRSFGNDTDLGPLHVLEKRDETQAYEAQLKAVKELRQISIPKDANDQDGWPDYVYEKAAGEGIYIYHVEMGVSDRDTAQKELPLSRLLAAVQTEYSKQLLGKPFGAEGRSHHGTCVASKAVGNDYGSAKKAFLVPVKIGEVRPDCITEGLEAAAEDIETKGRQRKAVVLVSLVTEYEVEANEDDPIVELQRESIRKLVELGIPVVSASGNWAQMKGDLGQLRTNVDTMPSVFASVYPMIPVGNVDWDGQSHPDSQGGDLLITSAMGTDIKCIDRKGKEITNTGTSFAAPLVAGYVAILLSVNDANMPFNAEGLSHRRFVRRVRNYIRDRAYWKSPSGNKVMRNGITRELYEKAQEEAQKKESGGDEEGDQDC